MGCQMKEIKAAIKEPAWVCAKFSAYIEVVWDFMGDQTEKVEVYLSPLTSFGTLFLILGCLIQL